MTNAATGNGLLAIAKESILFTAIENKEAYVLFSTQNVLYCIKWKDINTRVIGKIFK